MAGHAPRCSRHRAPGESPQQCPQEVLVRAYGGRPLRRGDSPMRESDGTPPASNPAGPEARRLRVRSWRRAPGKAPKEHHGVVSGDRRTRRNWTGAGRYSRGSRAKLSTGMPPLRSTLLLKCGDGQPSGVPACRSEPSTPMRLSPDGQLAVPGKVLRQVPGGHASKPDHPPSPSDTDGRRPVPEFLELRFRLRILGANRFDPVAVGSPSTADGALEKGFHRNDGPGFDRKREMSLKTQEPTLVRVGKVHDEVPGRLMSPLEDQYLHGTSRVDDDGRQGSRSSGSAAPPRTLPGVPVPGPTLAAERHQGHDDGHSTPLRTSRHKGLIFLDQPMPPTKGRVLVDTQASCRRADRPRGHHAGTERDPQMKLLRVREGGPREVAERSPTPSTPKPLPAREPAPSDDLRRRAVDASPGSSSGPSRVPNRIEQRALQAPPAGGLWA